MGPIRKVAGSFRMRLIIGLVLIIILVEGLSLLTLRERETARFNDELQTQSATVIDITADLLSTPLWDLNTPVLSSMIEGLTEQPGVVFATLRDVDGELLAAAGTRQDDALVLHREIAFGPRGTEQWIGDVIIGFDRGIVDQRLAASLRRESLLSLALMGLLLVPILALLSLVLDPLSRLAAATRRIKAGDLESPVPDLDRTDEVGALAGALDQLRIDERDMQEFRQSEETRNRTERRRMIRALSATSDGVVVFDTENRVTFRNAMAERILSAFHPAAALPTEALEHSIEQTLQLPVGEKAELRDIRLRVDPIRDEAGQTLGRVLLATDETEQTRAREYAEHIARHDMLTGLANRRFLEERLAEATEKGQAELALLVADLDRFKKINDTLGHVVGDSLLQHVGQVFRDLVRPVDTAVRIGGDEFAILSEGPGAGSRIEDYSAALLDRLGPRVMLGAREVRTGLSGGTARTGRGVAMHASAPSDLIRHADLALYKAKEQGGQTILPFRSEMEDAVTRRDKVEQALRVGVETGRGLTAVYQPQSDLKTREVLGFEALARLHDENGAPIPPAEFIPLAEESGLIVPLTAQILRSTMGFAMLARESGFPGRVAVNISPRLFEMDLVGVLAEARERTGCPSDLIELEITEQLVLSDDADPEDQIERLREAGYRVVLDDFGIGYSSFNYLQRFNFDKIKIDRAFASQAKSGAKAQRIIAAITDVGHALGAQVVAEGVETDADIAALEQTGIDIIQGWIDGRPRGAEALAGVLEEPGWWFDAELLKSA